MEKDQSSNEQFAYDSVVYPSYVISQTHPDFLAAIAKLSGLNPAPTEKCRVLELGCGTGTNPLWMAYNLPESEFVGIDLAQPHIAEAKKNAEVLQLKNVSFFRQNVLDMTAETFGKFDYIIAHGLYSWVPDFVRPKILGLYGELLNPDGVGFISYNVYPGCHRRQMIGEMMKFRTARIENPAEKVREGVEFIGFLTEHQTDLPAYQEILQYELQGFAGRNHENIYHDDLSEFNQPFYFTEFMADAEKHNLQFLGESDYIVRQRNQSSPKVQEFFDSISRNTIEYEQYSDFFDCRRFRQTLLCRKDAAVKSEIKPADVSGLYISSQLKPTSPEIDLNPDSFKEFVSKKGEPVTIGHVLTKMALVFLLGLGSHPIKFEELIEKSAEILRAQGFIIEDLAKESEITALLFLKLYSPNAIRFHLAPSNALDYVSERPMVSKFAVWQASHEGVIFSYHGGVMSVKNHLFYSLVNLLDGTRTKEDLLAELTKIANSNEEITEKEQVLAELPQNLERDLFILAKMGYLIG
jgi:SAM-dependent methyltransferase/methyltransferase-like protein